MLKCYYALGGMNYKNGVISVCPRQGDQLVFASETTLPSEIFNHKNFKEVRRKLHNGEWPSGCAGCEDMEQDNLVSMRQDYTLVNGRYCKNHGTDDNGNLVLESSNIPPLLECYNENTHETDFKGLRHLELRFSSACNFACLHCSKVFSTGWTKKLKNYVPDEEDRLNDLQQLLGTEHRHGPDDKNEISLSTEEALKIVEDLNENFPNVEYVDFSGGELLYQRQFFPTLEKLAEHPNAKNMNISFHSNFNAPKLDVTRLTDLLYPFKTSTIVVSIDAGRKIYPYFRHGGDWEQLQKNIEDFKNHANEDMHIIASITTSIYQMLDLYDIFDSIFDLEICFDASIVQTPKYINPSLIMHDFSEEVEQDIKKTYELIEKKEKRDRKIWDKYNRRSRYWFNYIIEYVKNTKLSYSHFNRFLVYRKKSDVIWNQNFNDYFDNWQIEENELVRVS